MDSGEVLNNDQPPTSSRHTVTELDPDWLPWVQSGYNPTPLMSDPAHAPTMPTSHPTTLKERPEPDSAGDTHSQPAGSIKATSEPTTSQNDKTPSTNTHAEQGGKDTRTPRDAQRHSLAAVKWEKGSVREEESAKERTRKDAIAKSEATMANTKAEAQTKPAQQAADKAVSEKQEKAAEAKQNEAEEQTITVKVTEVKAEKVRAKDEALAAEKQEDMVREKKSATESTRKHTIFKSKASKASTKAEEKTKPAHQAAEQPQFLHL